MEKGKISSERGTVPKEHGHNWLPGWDLYSARLIYPSVAGERSMVALSWQSFRKRVSKSMHCYLVHKCHNLQMLSAKPLLKGISSAWQVPKHSHFSSHLSFHMEHNSNWITMGFYWSFTHCGWAKDKDRKQSSFQPYWHYSHWYLLFKYDCLRSFLCFSLKLQVHLFVLCPKSVQCKGRA